MTIEHYRLYDCPVERRLIIDIERRERLNTPWTQGTMAESWLDAKQRLGFDLTAAQQWLLDEQKRRAA